MSPGVAPPRVSVVMPVFGVERYVGAAVDSVLRQTWRDFELIVVDDASPDRSIEIVRGFADDRIRVVRHARNRGVSAARNSGLDAARGGYVALLDGDDIARPDRLARQVRLLDAQPGLAGCGAGMRMMDGEGKQLGRHFGPPADPRTLRATLLFHNTFYTSTLMLRADAVRNVRYRTDFEVAEDYEFAARLTALGPMTNLPEALLHYRVRPASLTRAQPRRLTKWVQRVCAAQLEAMGLRPTRRQLVVHHHVGHLNEPPSQALLDESHAWLLVLQQNNRRSRVYDEAVFDQVLAMRWFELSTHAAGLGLGVLHQYRSSALSEAWRPPATRLGKFAVKSLLQRSFRPRQQFAGRST